MPVTVPAGTKFMGVDPLVSTAEKRSTLSNSYQEFYTIEDIVLTASGSDTNIYNTSGTLTANRTVTMSGNTLNFSGGYIGINQATPTVPLHIKGTAIPSTNEPLIRLEVSDASGSYLGLDNASLTDGQFVSQMIGRQSATSTQPAIYLTGAIDVAQDSGTSPVTVFRSTLSSLASVVTRPIFQFKNWATDVMTILANGNVGIGTTTPTEKLEVSGKTKTTTFQMTTAPTAGYVLTSDASGNGTWAAAGSSSGKFGIPDSTGAYTFYSTLGAAITAATAGQTIEFFTDYTETGAVTITLKDGVNINGNGHTYTCSASAGIAVFQNTGGTQVITDLTISATNADGNTAVFYMNGGTRTTFAGCVVKTTAGWGCRSWNGIIEGLTSVVTSAKAFFSQGGTFVNCRGYSTTGVAMDVAQGYAHNCYAYSTGSTGIYGGYGVYNCIGIGSSEGIECYGGNVYNSTGYSSSGYGIKITGGSIFNCTAISSASWGVFLYANNAVVSNCTIISTAANGIYSQFVSGCKISNNYITSSAAIAVRFNATSASFNNNHIDCTWNNAGGHAFQAGQSGDILCGNVFQVSNASANGLNAGSAVTTKYADSKFIGATTSVNANITQGMVNTEDTYGNITI